MKDKLYIGLAAGVIAPLFFVALFYLIRFNYLTISEFINQAILLKVHLKLIAVGIFFADLGLFFLFLKFNKEKAAKGVILSVLAYFFAFLLL